MLELRNIDVKIEDEDAALILLVSLPLSYDNFVQSFIVGKDSNTLEEVRSSLHTRELGLKAADSSSTDNPGAGLIASGSKGQGRKSSIRTSSFPRVLNPMTSLTIAKEKRMSQEQNKEEKQESSAAVAQGDPNSEEDLALAVNEQSHRRNS